MPIDHLPGRWQPGARSFRDWVATDKGVLLILALVFTGRALSFFSDSPFTLRHVVEVRYWWISPIVWGVSALLLWIALRRDSPRVESAALVVAGMVLATWGVLYLWTEPVHIPGYWGWLDWIRVVLEHLTPFLARGVIYIGLALFLVYTVWRGRFMPSVWRGDNVARL